MINLRLGIGSYATNMRKPIILHYKMLQTALSNGYSRA
jgi:hypothetical protein